MGSISNQSGTSVPLPRGRSVSKGVRSAWPITLVFDAALRPTSTLEARRSSRSTRETEAWRAQRLRAPLRRPRHLNGRESEHRSRCQQVRRDESDEHQSRSDGHIPDAEPRAENAIAEELLRAAGRDPDRAADEYAHGRDHSSDDDHEHSDQHRLHRVDDAYRLRIEAHSAHRLSLFFPPLSSNQERDDVADENRADQCRDDYQHPHHDSLAVENGESQASSVACRREPHARDSGLKIG